MVKQQHMVSFVLVNPQGEILLQQRDDKPGIAFPGHWTIFGGAVEDDDESLDAAVMREMWEELELDVPLTHWHTYICPVRSIPGALDVIVHVYVGEIDHPLDTLTLREGQAMGYFSRAGAAELRFGFAKLPIVMKFFDDWKNGAV
jgi:8-oxo-dGTP pyrophosphatase MutT (NUDIX family)